MATSGGGGTGAGEDVAGGGGGAGVDAVGGGGGGELQDVPLEFAEICGSSNPEICGSTNPTAGDCSLFLAAVSTLAKAWKARPTDSFRFTSSLGGVELDDEVWEVRFHLDDKDNLERSICRVDITFCNLLAMIEGERFGWRDIMYYVREQGTGSSGMAVVESIKDVEEMLSIYEDVKCVTITVIKAKGGLPESFNKRDCEEQVHLSDIGDPPIVYSVDVDGSLFESEDSDIQYLPTQQSNNHLKGKKIVQVETGEEYMLTQQSYIPVLSINSEEDDDINKRIIDLKRKRQTKSQQKENYFSEEEKLYNDSDQESKDSEFIIDAEQFEKKEARNAAPTSRSHYKEGTSSFSGYVPSSDEGKEEFLSDDDDDGFQVEAENIGNKTQPSCVETPNTES